MITVERLRQLLRYDQKTGKFFWLNKTGSMSAGSEAGTPHKGGRYTQIFVDRKGYKAHRLAWLYVAGEWPMSDIDHINGIGTDNSWDNLRLISKHGNLQNQVKAHSSNKTGYLGVHKQGNRYRSRLRVNGRNISLGMFDTAEAAHQAYIAAKREHHEGCTL